MDDVPDRKPLSFSEKMLDALAPILASMWQKVALKAGYAKDEVWSTIVKANYGNVSITSHHNGTLYPC